MLFGAFVQGKSAIENQPPSSLPVLRRDDQKGFLQPGSGANHLFKHLVNTCQRRENPCTPMCSPRPDHCCSHRYKKKCLQQGQESFLPHRDIASVFFPSFLSTLMMISRTQWITSKRCFTDPKAEGGGTASKSQSVLAPLSKHKSLWVVFTEDSCSPRWLKSSSPKLNLPEQAEEDECDFTALRRHRKGNSFPKHPRNECDVPEAFVPLSYTLKKIIQKSLEKE